MFLSYPTLLEVGWGLLGEVFGAKGFCSTLTTVCVCSTSETHGPLPPPPPRIPENGTPVFNGGGPPQLAGTSAGGGQIHAAVAPSIGKTAPERERESAMNLSTYYAVPQTPSGEIAGRDFKLSI